MVAGKSLERNLKLRNKTDLPVAFKVKVGALLYTVFSCVKSVQQMCAVFAGVELHLLGNYLFPIHVHEDILHSAQSHRFWP